MHKLPPDWKDEPDHTGKNRLGKRGLTKSHRRMMAKRAKNIPPDDVLWMLKANDDARKNINWHIKAYNVKLLSLARNPDLSISAIAREMNAHFKTFKFTENTCHGRLLQLRRIHEWYLKTVRRNVAG